MRRTQITYKRSSLDSKRTDLIRQLNALDEASRALRADLRAVSSNSEARSEYRTPREFNQYVGSVKHKILMLKTDRENVAIQIGRLNKIIRNRNSDRRRRNHTSR